MKKKNFTNLINGRGHSTSADFTPKDKSIIFSTLESYGMNRSTAYNRFFRDGFERWEIEGIENLLKRYCEALGIDNTITCLNENFYISLNNKGKFKAFMSDNGMGLNTVIARFTNYNFKKWELKGIEQIINDHFIDEEV